MLAPSYWINLATTLCIGAYSGNREHRSIFSLYSSRSIASRIFGDIRANCQFNYNSSKWSSCPVKACSANVHFERTRFARIPAIALENRGDASKLVPSRDRSEFGASCRNVSIEVSVQVGCPDLQEMPGACSRPTHVLALFHALIDQVLRQTLRYRSSNTLTTTCSSCIVDRITILSTNICLQSLDTRPDLARWSRLIVRSCFNAKQGGSKDDEELGGAKCAEEE